MKVLIIDDTRSNREMLAAILLNAGMDCLKAENGIEAIEIFRTQAPDLVISDIAMPGMDGFATATEIKQIAGERFVPVILITPSDDLDAHIKAIDVGGDDFLTHPFSPQILLSKIKAMERIRQLHERLRVNQQTLELLHSRQNYQLRVANHVFTNIIEQGGESVAGLKTWSFSSSLFNADLVLSGYTPDGGINAFVGDFSGHGLAAALGGVPLTDIFYGMTKKGFSIGDILVEINAKLQRVLPIDMFCAACMVEITADRHSVSIWNGGMPDCIVTSADGTIKHTVQSSFPPLGVLSDDTFRRQTTILPIATGDHIYTCSDGFINTKNSSSEKLGIRGYHELIKKNANGQSVFEKLKCGFHEHINECKPNDDVTLVEIEVTPTKTWSGNKTNNNQKKKATIWEADLLFDNETLKSLNPVPVILNYVIQVQQPIGHKEKIFTLLSELFANALDHGILKLDSKLKKDASGFSQYYKEKQKRLLDLNHGWIRFKITNIPLEEISQLTITLEDSGDGFEYTNISSEFKQEGFSGRGIPLIRSLCKSVEYLGNGNVVKVVYEW